MHLAVFGSQQVAVAGNQAEVAENLRNEDSELDTLTYI